VAQWNKGAAAPFNVCERQFGGQVQENAAACLDIAASVTFRTQKT